MSVLTICKACELREAVRGGLCSSCALRGADEAAAVIDFDEDEDELVVLVRKHAILRYHAVGREPFDRAITCYCGWKGHEDAFGAHRRANGMKT